MILFKTGEKYVKLFEMGRKKQNNSKLGMKQTRTKIQDGQKTHMKQFKMGRKKTHIKQFKMGRKDTHETIQYGQEKKP